MDMCVEMAKVLLWYETIPESQVQTSWASFSSSYAGIVILSCKLCINNGSRTERTTKSVEEGYNVRTSVILSIPKIIICLASDV
jgi:IMP cyclohydrolase